MTLSALGRGFGWLAGVLATAAPGWAEPVRVGLDWPSGTRAGPAPEVRLTAAALARPGAVSLPEEVGALSSEAGTVLDLSAGLWTLRASVAGHWAEPVEVDVGRGTTVTTRIVLWPASSLSGELTPFGSEAMPASLDVRLTAAPASGGAGDTRERPHPANALIRCPVNNGLWSCPAPAGLFDVEVRPYGYVPYYASAVGLIAGANHVVGRIDLRREASVSGWLARADGSRPAGPCRAALGVEARRHPPSGERAEGGGVTAVAAFPDERGFFQLVGVPPGEHVLSAECVAASAFKTVTVRPEAETRLDGPLVLEELTLDLLLTPRLDPSGRPWRVTVSAIAPRWRSLAEQAPVSAEGRWSRRGLTRGTYRVDVTSGDGAQWMSQSVRLDETTGRLSWEVPLLEVAGRVQLDARPLRARLAFVNEAGGEAVHMESGPDGAFQGRLPTAPAAGSRWAVEVHASDPPINRRLEEVVVAIAPGEASAWLELTLPAVAARGTVISEDGRPGAGAHVSAEETATGIRTLVTANEDGSFELGELPEGAYLVIAESAQGFSERTPLSVTQGATLELRLVLKRTAGFIGHVASRDGPVAGAAVQIWIPPGVPRAFLRTDAAGRFEHDLPPDVTEVGITVGAPGYALKMARLVIGDTEEVVIPLEAAAGRLVLHAGASPGSEATTLLLAHGGAIELVGALAQWDPPDRGSAPGRPIVIPHAEPGVYALCRVDAPDVSAIWLGRPLPEQRCTAGTLGTDGDLELSLSRP